MIITYILLCVISHNDYTILPFSIKKEKALHLTKALGVVACMAVHKKKQLIIRFKLVILNPSQPNKKRIIP